MAVNKPVGDRARKGAMRKRTQLTGKVQAKSAWTKAQQGERQVYGCEEVQKEVQGRAAREESRLALSIS
jgi:hypothetical protein